MKLTQEQLNSFIERVLGTTLNMDTVLEEEYGVPGGTDGLDQSTLSDIDAAVFECEGCNWVVPRDEESTGVAGFCDDCVTPTATPWGT
jgi:hypothetical protein